LSNSHQTEILSSYKNFKDIEGLTSVRRTKDIESNDYSLAIPLYVDKMENVESHEISSLQEDIEHWVSSSINSENALNLLLSEIVRKE
jgi:type I restriction-modification system DNA methylase subunit